MIHFLPGTFSLTKNKFIYQISTELNNIFMKKVLYTEKCSGCLLCFALDQYPVQITNKITWR